MAYGKKVKDYRFKNIWHAMNARCKNKTIKNYGAKGIRVEWKSFEEFENDMWDLYCKHKKLFGEKQTTIDRINGDNNYSKENCKWATYKEQIANQPPRKRRKGLTYKI